MWRILVLSFGRLTHCNFTVDIKYVRSVSLYPYICNIFSILNKLTLQKIICKFVTNIVFWDKKSNNTTTTLQK